MRSRLTWSKPAARASATAAVARPGVCRRSSTASTCGAADCMPSETRVNPAERSPRSGWRRRGRARTRRIPGRRPRRARTPAAPRRRAPARRVEVARARRLVCPDVTELVRVHAGGGVATLTLDSPHNRNALSTALMTELLTALGVARNDDAVRAIVLSHTGPVFCSGADLKETAAATAGGGTVPASRLGNVLA